MGEPARRHGIPDTAVWRAIRTATRRVVMDENLTMPIGPAVDGALVEISILDLDRDDPVVIHATPLRPKFSIDSLDQEATTMLTTDGEIDSAAHWFEQSADALDPATASAEATDDLRAVAASSEAVRADEARLREAVAVARAHGRSWNQIAVPLGTPRQAARQRFSGKAQA